MSIEKEGNPDTEKKGNLEIIKVPIERREIIKVSIAKEGNLDSIYRKRGHCYEPAG